MPPRNKSSPPPALRGQKIERAISLQTGTGSAEAGKQQRLGKDVGSQSMSRIYHNTSLQNKPVHNEKVDSVWSPAAYERYEFKLLYRQ